MTTGGGDPGVRGSGGSEPGGREWGPRRPLIERLGMAAIAAALAILFGGAAVASLVGGEVFLAVMAAIGALMTAWAGANTAFRG